MPDAFNSTIARPGSAEHESVAAHEIRPDRPLIYSAGAFVIPSYTGEGDVVMTADPTGVQDIVESLLATQLAAQDEATTRLRETLLAWLVEGGNARRAAERVHAHKNTVLYRLGRAQQILGRPLDADRGELELALTAMQLLGGRIAKT